MAKFNFPTSPSTNQTYTANSVTWKWNGHAWKRTTGVGAPTGPQGAQGHQGVQGAQGSVGSTGAGGSTGAQGHQGRQGAAGTVGAQGAQGAQGVQGSPASNASTLNGQAASYYLNYNNLNNRPTIATLLYIDVYGSGTTTSRDTARNWATSAVSVPNNTMFSVRWHYYHSWNHGNSSGSSDQDLRTLWYKNGSGSIYWATGS